MKILHATVLLVIFSFFGAAYAATSPLMGGATPIQSFQTAGSRSAVVAPEKVMHQASRAPNSAAVSELESQMTQLNQAALQYQQQANRKMEHLTWQVSQVQTKLEKLTEAMMLLNQQQSALSRKAGATTHSTQSAQHNGRILSYWPFAIMGILAIMMGWIMSRQKNIMTE